MNAGDRAGANSTEALPDATTQLPAAEAHPGFQSRGGGTASADDGAENPHPQYGSQQARGSLQHGSSPLHLGGPSVHPRGPPPSSAGRAQLGPSSSSRLQFDGLGHGTAPQQQRETHHGGSERSPPRALQRGDPGDDSASIDRHLPPASPMSISPDDSSTFGGDRLQQSSARTAAPLPSESGAHHSNPHPSAMQQRFWSTHSSPSSATAKTRRNSTSAESPSLVPAFPSSAGFSSRSSTARGSPQGRCHASPSPPSSVAPSPSAATMFQVASQAGLHSVSSALVSQAHTIDEATAIGRHHHSDSVTTASGTSVGSDHAKSPSPFRAAAAPPDLLPGRRSSPHRPPGQSTDTPPRDRRAAEGPLNYSAIMTAHLSSALEGAKQMSLSSPSSHTSDDSAMNAALAAQVRMANIATKTATEEAERQLRIHALLRASGGHTLQINDESKDSLVASPSGTSGDSQQGGSLDRASSATRARMQAMGLGHIPLPSKGFEQAWGRKDDSGAPQSSGDSQAGASDSVRAPARYYDAADALAGVPSMPLMPAPPLVMLPPPTSPTLERLGLPGFISTRASPPQRVSADAALPMGLQQSKSGATDHLAASGAKSFERYAFDVIQTPGGTVQAGFWVPHGQVTQGDRQPSHAKDQAEPEAIAAATAPAPANASAVPNGHPATSRPASSAASTAAEYFHPCYTFDGKVYAALATQAAYATSLLTTTTGAAGVSDMDATRSVTQNPLDSLGHDAAALRPLSPEQQEAIAKQLCAWAGLEGPEEQSRARESLEARMLQLVTSGPPLSKGDSVSPNGSGDVSKELVHDHDGRNGVAKAALVGLDSDDAGNVSPVQVCFPPDFASHYRAQLQALTEGYYRQIHQEALQKDHFAGDADAQGFESIDDRAAVEHSQQIAQSDGASDATPVSSTTPPTSVKDQAANDHTSRSGRRSRFSVNSTRGRHASQRFGGVPPRSSVSSAAMDTLQEDPRPGQDGVVDPVVIARAQSLGMPPSSVAAVVDNAVPPKSPVPQEGAQDPMEFLAHDASVQGVAKQGSELSLEQLLSSAHQFYQFGSKTIQVKRPDGTPETKTELHPLLLPLLHTLHKKQPRHLPTLLLLSCAYYSAGDLSASLYWNDQILTLDSRYVEAMSNIGTTLRALGRHREAESWWFKAIRLRPAYWDAYENLLGVLCTPQQGDSTNNAANVQDLARPRYSEALALCEHVESHVTSRHWTQDDMPHKLPAGDRPLSLPESMAASSVPRLQQLLYAKGNLKYAISGTGSLAAKEYARAVELVVSPIETRAYSLRDLVVATCIAGLLSLGATLGQHAAADGAVEISRALGLDVNDPRTATLVASAQWATLCPGGGLLELVKQAGERLVKTMLRLGGGQLPMVMLLPEPAKKVTKVLFPDVNHWMPAIRAASIVHREAPAQVDRANTQCSQTTSTILLTLAKLFSDATAKPADAQHGMLNLGGIPPSVSLQLPLYYLSLSLHPSASTCNNLGIILSGLPIVTTVISHTGVPTQMNGQGLAMTYYTAGIQMDKNHPHLYTNFGSLLKDLGHLKEAIQNYEKAVELHPTFNVALANLGNSLRDAGRTEDSLPYYRRALAAPGAVKMPEAMCGLLNGLLQICDWTEAFSRDAKEPGLLCQVAELVETQLDEGTLYGMGAFQSSGPRDAWLRRVLACINEARPEAQRVWFHRISAFYRHLDRPVLKISEGGFLIRLIEHLHRRMQWRWYQDTFGSGRVFADVQASTAAAPAIIRPTASDVMRYSRSALPPSLVVPAVPTVLPFHTFSYGIEGIMSPRALRLISHRNAIRISNTTLTQPWLPPHVYPPPPPPAPKIRVGYVSSDFNNHPLAHLMQSVFGMHDLSRFEIFLYATTASDNSPYRQKIEAEAHHFLDVSAWSNAQVIDRILNDGIHILMNLNGYTKGARNEIFAARPCPVQMQFMGFAGGMGSGWTDYVVVDPVVCPPEATSIEHWHKRRRQRRAQGILAEEDPSSELERPTHLPGDLDPEEPSDDWVYTERFIYMPHSYFVNDHKQGFREPETRTSDLHGGIVHPREMSAEEAWAEEEERRWKARKELFPGLPDDYVVFATFNQLYKIEPVVFQSWLKILKSVPNSILWLLRFPAAGQANIVRSAREWAGDEVASRIVFTDVAPKEEHIRRGRVADLFLDTFEVNAHTTACDCLWSGTPILTLPKWKMKQASMVAASIAMATGFGEQMIVKSVEEYVARAVALAASVKYTYVDQSGAVLPQEPVLAAESRFTTASEVARLGASAKIASQAQAKAATTGPGAQSHPDASKQTADQQQQQQQGEVSSDATSANDGNHVVPAPITVQNNSLDDAAQATKPSKPSPNGVSPHHGKDGTVSNEWPSPSIKLPIGAQAPAGTAFRRGHGELLSLRRDLFLQRDRMPLFDTRGWVRDLERGYAEAWRRWALGTDAEESAEWDAMVEAAAAAAVREGCTKEEVERRSEAAIRRNSGHIWVAELE